MPQQDLDTLVDKCYTTEFARIYSTQILYQKGMSNAIQIYCARYKILYDEIVRLYDK